MKSYDDLSEAEKALEDSLLFWLESRVRGTSASMCIERRNLDLDILKRLDSVFIDGGKHE